MKKHCFYGCITLLMLGSSGVFATAGTSASPQTTVQNPFQGGSTPTVATNNNYAVSPSLVLHENELLSQGVKKWVEGNGYKLLWNSKKDYLIYNDITMSGRTDDDVLQQLGELFFSENYGLVVKKYEKNRVVVIDEL